MMPSKIEEVVKHMIEKVTQENKLVFHEFISWLDLNPEVRTIVKESLRPSLWSLTDPSDPRPKSKPSGASCLVCGTPKLKNQSSRNGCIKQGYLQTIKNVGGPFKKVYCVLKEGTLMVFNQVDDAAPEGK